MSPEQLLGQFEADDRVVLADMEAGAGTLTRMHEGALDIALLVVEPSAKSIEVAHRASAIIGERKIGLTMVVANRVRDEADVELIRTSFPGLEVAVVPDDPSVIQSDREGRSPLDVAPDGLAVQAVAQLARRLNRWSAPTQGSDLLRLVQ